MKGTNTSNMLSHTEENYLKAIFKICEKNGDTASTNAISKEMRTSAASVTDMLKRLAEKTFIHYEKYKGVTLTKRGNTIATMLIRKHRLWEVFLLEKLNFSWDEVHDIAEQLEHIKSDELIKRLDQFLAFPKIDPHGDPIPDADGHFHSANRIPLIELQVGERGVVVGVQEHSSVFLQYLDRLQLGLGAKLQVKEKFEYDDSMKVKMADKSEQILTSKISMNLFVEKM